MSSHIVMGVILISCMANAVFMLTLYPIIFWISVIPRIEERVGHKLKFHPQYDFFPFGKFFIAPVELGYTISLMYFGLKILKDKSRMKFDKTRALINVNYDIEAASRSELVISFIGFSCLILVGIQAFCMFLILYLHPVPIH